MKSKEVDDELYLIEKSVISEDDVRKELMPELELIKDACLREKVVKAWTLACKMGGYSRLDDIPSEAFEWAPDVPNIKHQKESARIAAALVKVLREFGVELNEDYCIAGALCHDLGKPIEWRNKQPGIYAIRNGTGTFYGKNPNMPTIGDKTSYQVARHPVWGFYIAMAVGMPEHLAHIIGSHSREGDLLLRSPEAWIVRYADEIWWSEVGTKHMGGFPGGPIPDKLEDSKSHPIEPNWKRPCPQLSREA